MRLSNYSGTSFITLQGDFKEELSISVVRFLREIILILTFMMVTYLSGRKLPKTVTALKRKMRQPSQ